MSIIRSQFRDPRHYVADPLLKFLNLDKLPEYLTIPAEYRSRWRCVLKADPADFVVCEPVPEYMGMPPELAADIRAKKRFLSVEPGSDMPGLRTDIDIFIIVQAGTSRERIGQIVDDINSLTEEDARTFQAWFDPQERPRKRCSSLSATLREFRASTMPSTTSAADAAVTERLQSKRLFTAEQSVLDQDSAEGERPEPGRCLYVRVNDPDLLELAGAMLSRYSETFRLFDMTVPFRGRRVPAVAMTVVKTGENTWTVVDEIAKFISRHLGRPIHHGQVLTSGLKDKRAWTVQTVVVVDVSMREMQSINWPSWETFVGGRRGWFVKDVRPTNRRISQGDHAWNGFVIRVRVDGKSAAELEKYMAYYALGLKLKNSVIPDGFHLQRLGPGQDMQLLGETELTGNYVPSPLGADQALLVQELDGVEGVSVLAGDFGYIESDALVSVVDQRGTCVSNQVEQVIRRAAGDGFHSQIGGRNLSRGEVVSAKLTSGHGGAFGDCLFVSNDGGTAFATWSALQAADAMGYRTVTIPALNMNVSGATAKLAEAVRRFMSSQRKSVQRVNVVGFYEPDPFSSNVEAMLHRLCTEPAARDKPEVTALKEQIRRQWLVYFDKSERGLRRLYKSSNMSLEYEVLKRYADYDPCERCGKQLPEKSRRCPHCHNEQSAGHRYQQCPEAILYDVRDRLSLAYGAFQGFFANQEILRQIETGQSLPGDGKRIALPMSCAESYSLYAQSETGRECLRMLAATEELAGPAEPYFYHFVDAYWAGVEKERARQQSEIDARVDLWTRLYNTLRQADKDRIDGLLKDRSKLMNLVKLHAGPNGKVDTVQALLFMDREIQQMYDQLDELDVPDADTGLSFGLVLQLFSRISPKPAGIELERPSTAALSAAFIKHLYLTPRDRKTGAKRARPPRRNVFAAVENFGYTCEEGSVVLRFALPRGSYATMLVALMFDTTDKRLAEVVDDSAVTDEDVGATA